MVVGDASARKKLDGGKGVKFDEVGTGIKKQPQNYIFKLIKIGKEINDKDLGFNRLLKQSHLWYEHAWMCVFVPLAILSQSPLPLEPSHALPPLPS